MNGKSRLRQAASILFTLLALLMFAWAATTGLTIGSVPDNASTTTYRVQSGDTVFGIAHKFDPAMDPRAVDAWIEQHDGVHDGVIQPGQVLEVPVMGGK